MRLNSIAFVFLLLLTACASKEGELDQFLDTNIRSAEDIYNNAVDYVLDYEYFRAIDEFKRVEDQYPYSVWVRNSIIMTAWTHYLVNQYDESVLYLDRFLSLYPGNKDSDYVYYLRAMCFYERIGEINRDPTFALQAAQSFNQLIGFFPNSIYARDGLAKLSLVQAALAANEMYLGRIAIEKNQYGAALKRFRSVIVNYNKTAYAPEALHRQVEIYLTLGIDGEARRMGAILGFNYPSSKWYKHSYDLLSQFATKATQKNESTKTARSNPISN